MCFQGGSEIVVFGRKNQTTVAPPPPMVPMPPPHTLPPTILPLPTHLPSAISLPPVVTASFLPGLPPISGDSPVPSSEGSAFNPLPSTSSHHFAISSSASSFTGLNMSHSPLQPNVTHSISTTIEDRKNKLIQQHLVMLLHAQKCLHKAQQGQTWQCQVPQCITMKKILLHMNVCSRGLSCPHPDCTASQKISSHWKACINCECMICVPVKLLAIRLSVDPHSDKQYQKQNGTAAGPSVSQDSDYHSEASEDGQQQSGLPTENAFLSFLNAEKPNSLRDAVRMLHNIPSIDILALRTTVQKLFHPAVPTDIRSHLIARMVLAICPAIDSVTNRRLYAIVTHARRIEVEVYEQANSRAEYYFLISEKIQEAKNLFGDPSVSMSSSVQV